MSEAFDKDKNYFDADEVPPEFYFDEEDDDDEDYTGIDNLGRNHEEVMRIVTEMDIDPDMRKNLTVEELPDYDYISFNLQVLGGDYIAEFNRRMEWGGIKVSDAAVAYLEKHNAPMQGFDPRTGVYGLKYAAAGFFSAGCAYMVQEEWDKAIANFSKAIELWPRHIYARGYKGFCHYKQKDFLRAGSELWNAINLNPVMIASQDEASRPAFARLDDPTVQLLKCFLQEHLVNSGITRLEEDDYDTALADFNDAIKFNPVLAKPEKDKAHFLAKAHHGRLAVYMAFSHNWKFDEWDKIIADCDMLIKLNNEVVYALECRGIAYDALKKNEEALADYTAAIKIAPNQASLYDHRLWCYARKKEYDKALADANEALRLGDPVALEHRGIMYNYLGEYEKAIADFDEVLRRDKYNRPARYQRKKARALLKGEPFEYHKDDEP